MKVYEVFLQSAENEKSVLVVSYGSPNEAMAQAQLKNPGWKFIGFKDRPFITDGD